MERVKHSITRHHHVRIANIVIKSLGKEQGKTICSNKNILYIFKDHKTLLNRLNLHNKSKLD